MSENQRERITSFAKTIDPDYEKTVLERNLRLTAQFEQARTPQRPREQPAHIPERSHAPTPAMHLRPNQWTRQNVDRRVFNEAQNRLDGRVNARNEAAKARQDQQKLLEMENERNIDHHDRGR